LSTVNKIRFQGKDFVFKKKRHLFSEQALLWIISFTEKIVLFRSNQREFPWFYQLKKKTTYVCKKKKKSTACDDNFFQRLLPAPIIFFALPASTLFLLFYVLRYLHIFIRATVYFC
jgi:hypothetical protein